MAARAPPKKTKAQIEAEKAAAEAAAEAERKAAEERAVLEAKKREEERIAAALRAAELRRLEVERLTAACATEAEVVEAQHARLVATRERRAGAAAWEEYRVGAARTVANFEAMLAAALTQLHDADAAARARVLEGSGSMLAPPALVNVPLPTAGSTTAPTLARPSLAEVYTTSPTGGAMPPRAPPLPSPMSASSGLASPLRSPSAMFGATAGSGGGGGSSGGGGSGATSLPVSVGVGIRAPYVPPMGPVPPVRVAEEVVTPFSPGLAACTALATLADETQCAIANAVEVGDAATAHRLRRYLVQMRDLISRRLDAISYELMEASSEFAVELKDGVRELHSFAHFDVLPTRVATRSAHQLEDASGDGDGDGSGGGGGGGAGGTKNAAAVRRAFAAARVAGDVLMWANLGPAKVLRTKTVRNLFIRDKIVPKDADSNASICADLHKHVASLHAALRVARTEYDHAAAVADAVAAAEDDIARSPGVAPEDIAVGGVAPGATTRTSRTSGRMASSRTSARSAAGGRRTSARGPHTSARSADSDGKGAAAAAAAAAAAKGDEDEKKDDGDDKEGKADDGEGDEEEEEEEETGRGERRALAGRTARSGAQVEEETAVTAAEADRILLATALRTVGGVVHVELLALPTPPAVVKGWLITKSSAALHPPFHVHRLPHPAVGQGASAVAQAVKVRIRVPEHVVVPPAAGRRVARWVRLSSRHQLSAAYHGVPTVPAAAVGAPGDIMMDVEFSPRSRRMAAAVATTALLLAASGDAAAATGIASDGASVGSGGASGRSTTAAPAPAAPAPAPADAAPGSSDAAAAPAAAAPPAGAPSGPVDARQVTIAAVAKLPVAAAADDDGDASAGYWRCEDTLDLAYDDVSRVLTFSTLHMGAHALVQPRHYDMPYASWALTPVFHPEEVRHARAGGRSGLALDPAADPRALLGMRGAASAASLPAPLASPTSSWHDTAEDEEGTSHRSPDFEDADGAASDGGSGGATRRNAAVLRVTTARHHVAIMVHDDGSCRLVGPTDVPELRYLIGSDPVTGSDAVVVPPGQLLLLLARSGINLVPADIDAHMANLDRAAAMAEAAAAASIADADGGGGGGGGGAAGGAGGAGGDADSAGGLDSVKGARAGGVAFALPSPGGSASDSKGDGDGDDAAGGGGGGGGDGASPVDRLAALPAYLPLRPKEHDLEAAVYADVARLAGVFSFASSKWNAHASVPPSTAVLRATETLLPPLVPGSAAAIKAAEDVLTEAATGAAAASLDPTRWRQVAFVADADVPCHMRAMLVADTEAAGTAACAAAVEAQRKAYYATLYASASAASAAAAAAAAAASAAAATADGGGDAPALPPAAGGAGAPAPAAAAAAAAAAPATSAPAAPATGAPEFTGHPEDGSEAQCSARHALAPRASDEALRLVAATSPSFVHAVERLLALIRPLSFGE